MSIRSRENLILGLRKHFFLGYPEETKGYKLWLIEDKKIILSRDVIFNEFQFYKPNQLVENSHKINPDSFKFEVESDDQQGGNLESNSNLENSQDSMENNELTSSETDLDAPNLANLDSAASSHEDLSDYWLSRDRIRRETKPLTRYAYADITAYALNIGDTIELHEPLTFADACTSKHKAQWLKVMQEEMDSRHKNKTWTLVQ